MERLRGAAAERKQFEAEIRDLRVRLESLERAGGAGEAAASRAAVVAELKAAVAELREG